MHLNQLRFVDISGVGNSGKTAAADLLREVEGVHVPPYWFEFDFIRIPNGLLDLRHRLLEDWSPVRSHYGIKAFLHAAGQMGRDPAWWDVQGLLQSSSQRYDKYFYSEFVRITEEFAKSLVQLSYVGGWPYDDMQLWSGWRLLRKVAFKLGLRRQLWREVLVPSGTDFDVHATTYLNKLYSKIVPEDHTHAAFNNGFEPFNPIPGLNMIAGSRQIVVTRDPRDVYVSGLNKHKVGRRDKKLLPFDNDGLSKSFLGTNNLSEFIGRQRLLYEHLYKGSDRRVLRLRFEDLCLAYDETAARIFEFLDIDRKRHVKPRTFFIPEKSRSGIGLWRSYSKTEETDRIAQELPEILYNG